MASEDIKKFLEQQTHIPEKQWKRLSKSKNSNGEEVRIFEDKISGKVVHTIEKNDGTFAIINNENSIESTPSNSSSISSFTPPQKKAAKKLIEAFLNEQKEPDENRVGFAAIPSFFNFCFLEDANCDWTEELEKISNSNDPNTSVAGVNIFISLKDKSLCNSSCFHLQPLLYPFLLDSINEVEESTFNIDKSEPIAYNQFVATLEQKGFTYEKENCMLANLGGSLGASPLLPPKSNDIKPKFTLLAIKQVSWEEPNPTQYRLMTALVVEHPSLKTRKAKEKLIQQTLKKYVCHPPGRLSNGNIPQLNIIQMIRKAGHLMHTDVNDRLAIYNALINEGWQLDLELATLDKVKDWKCEDWTKEPFEKQTPYHDYLATRTDIAYFMWQPGIEVVK